jgi:hypothetical protein
VGGFGSSGGLKGEEFRGRLPRTNLVAGDDFAAGSGEGWRGGGSSATSTLRIEAGEFRFAISCHILHLISFLEPQ